MVEPVGTGGRVTIPQRDRHARRLATHERYEVVRLTEGDGAGYTYD